MITTAEVNRLRQEISDAVYAADPQAAKERDLVDGAGFDGYYDPTPAYDAALDRIHEQWTVAAKELVTGDYFAALIAAYGEAAVLRLVQGWYLGPEDVETRLQADIESSLDRKHGRRGSLEDLVTKFPEHVGVRPIRQFAPSYGGECPAVIREGIEIIVRSSIGEAVLNAVETDNARPGEAILAAGEFERVDGTVLEFRNMAPVWAGF